MDSAGPSSRSSRVHRLIARRRFLGLMGVGGLAAVLIAVDLGNLAADGAAQLVLLLPPVDNPEPISEGEPPGPAAAEAAPRAAPTSTATGAASMAPSAPYEPPTPTVASPTPRLTLFEMFTQPLQAQARQRRQARQAEDPEGYNHRVDATLNADRLNILLFGYGISNEASGPNWIGSHTVLSYHSGAAKIDLISLTHDIRAPEIERYSEARGKPIKATKMHLAYETGGFELQRLVLENATGLAIDFQLNMDDIFVKRFIETTCGKIMVDNPDEFRSQTFFLEGAWYDEKLFPKGWLALDGFETMRYMKTLPHAYNPRVERNVRKHLVLEALLRSMERNYRNPLWLAKVAALLRTEVRGGRLTPDFEIDDLVLKSLLAIADAIHSQGLPDSSGQALLPRIDKTLYVVYIDNGDGGVRWVGVDALFNSLSKQELAEGVYPEESVAIPYFADARHPDLVSHYWPSVRNLVRRTLVPPSAPSRRE